MIEKMLGKIRRVQFGFGGYDNAMVGFSFDLSGESWATGDFWGTWARRSETAQWTEESQIKIFGDNAARVRDMLADAKVKSLDELTGVPVEVTFLDQRLHSWRVLKEVI